MKNDNQGRGKAPCQSSDEQAFTVSPGSPEEDDNEHARPSSLSGLLREHSPIRRADSRDSSSSIKVPFPRADTIDNLHRERQDEAGALEKLPQEIGNIHTYVQGKSAGILEEAISKLVSDLKNKRFENKKISRG